MMNLNMKNITFKYENNDQPTIQHLSFQVSKGEKVAMLGKNGMGKSTLFLLANGVLTAQSGDLYIDDVKIKAHSKQIYLLRQKVGLVFQNPDSQFIAPTVMEEISFAALNRGLTNEATLKLVMEIMKALKIDHLKDRPLHSLSGGEKKMVSIASILSLEPELIFLDEPTAGLDYINSQQLLSVLEQLHQDDYGLVISTHDIDFAWEWANRIVILEKGKIIADGATEEILTNQTLMEKASLRLPYLVEFMQMNGKKWEHDQYPKTVQELGDLLKEQK